MQPLKDANDHKLLATIVKHDLNDTELELMRLPDGLEVYHSTIPC